MIAWLCYNPTRLVMACLALFVVTVPVAMLLTRDAQPTARPAATVTLPPINPDAATETAHQFVDLWCEIGQRTPEQWAQQMRAMTTPAFGQSWTPANAANLTGDCRYGQYKPRFVEPHRVRVFVVTKGSPVLVDVVQGPRGELQVAGIAADTEGGD